MMSQKGYKHHDNSNVFLKRLLGHMQGVPKSKAPERTDVHIDELEEKRCSPFGEN
jgi:hypothetical protein